MRPKKAACLAEIFCRTSSDGGTDWVEPLPDQHGGFDYLTPKKKEVQPAPLDMLRLYPCFWQNVFLQVAELLIFPARAWSPKQPSLVIEELFGINNLFSKILCIHHLGGLLSCQKRCVGSTITGSESKPRTEGSACCSKSQTAAWKNPRQPRQKSKIM